MMKNFIKFYLLMAIFAVLLLPVFPVNAGLLDGLNCANSSLPAAQQKCDLNDFVLIAVNISKFILGITGSLALLAFIIGGFMFLLSGGSPQRVEQGKGFIKGAIIGLLIVFLSYSIIQFVLRSSGAIGESDTNLKTTGNTWNAPPPNTPSN